MSEEDQHTVGVDVVIEIDDFQDPPPSEDMPQPVPTKPGDRDQHHPDPPRRGSTVTLQGKSFSPAFRDALQELIKLVGFTVTITQGGFNGDRVAASAGTHAGDAVDFSVRNLSKAQVTALISTARQVGIATWFRTTKTAKWGTRAHGFTSYHVHGVPNGWGLPSASAKSQADSYRNGKDALKSQQADLGPGHVSGFRKQTWQSYLAQRDSTTTTTQSNTTVDVSALPALIAEDGDFGTQTIKRWQRQVRVTQDGDFGRVTKSAVRTWLRFPPGPQFDAPVIKALQGRVGVGKDGDFGSVTVKALQKFLNANRTH